jgi:hypothetical protein
LARFRGYSLGSNPSGIGLGTLRYHQQVQCALGTLLYD